MRVSCRHWSVKIGVVFFIQERRTKMEKRDKKIPYEVVIQERKRGLINMGTILQTNGNSGARVLKRNTIELIVI